MSRSSTIAVLALALGANTYGYQTGDEWVHRDLPPIDPHFKIKRPANSWGRKSKKKGRRS